MNVLERPFAGSASVTNVRQNPGSLLQDSRREDSRDTLDETDEERVLIEALRKGEEIAFSTLIDRYHGRLLRLAKAFVPSEAVAEEVVQETWIHILEGIHRFEGRSSLKTCIFKILTNRAKTRGIRESRYVSLTDSRAGDDDEGDDDLGPDKYLRKGPFADHSVVIPLSWEQRTPERWLLSKECGEQIEQAIRRLPEAEQKVVVLRDVEGMNTNDICAMLQITETHQRVLLHRARAKVRNFLDGYLQDNSTKLVNSDPLNVTRTIQVATASP